MINNMTSNKSFLPNGGVDRCEGSRADYCMLNQLEGAMTFSNMGESNPALGSSSVQTYDTATALEQSSSLYTMTSHDLGDSAGISYAEFSSDSILKGSPL